MFLNIIKKYNWYICLFLICLVLRIFCGYYSHYTEDEARLWQLGFYAFKDMSPINHGMPVVYSNSLIPGYFQSLFASIPMFFSTSPFSMIVYIQFLNLIFCVFLYLWITFLFKQFKNIYVFAFIIFSPWNIYFSNAWNASLATFFSLFVILGLTLVFYKKHVNFGVFLCLLIPPLALQTNLQFLIIIVLLGVLFLIKLFPFPRINVLVFSQIPAILTLYPYFLIKLNLVKLDEPTWGFLDSASKNLKPDIYNLLNAPHTFYKLMSFSTGDLYNRFEKGFLSNNLYLIPLLFIIELMSFVIIFINVSFYFSKKRWSILFNVRNLAKNNKLTIMDKFDIICLIVPIIIVFLSLFSVTKKLPNHSLLCVFFVSFYILFRRLSELKFDFLDKYKKIIIFYISIAAVYSVIASASFRTTYDMYKKIAPVYCKSQDIKYAIENIGFKTLIKENLYSGMAYTSSLLCPYYNSLKNGNL